MHLSRSLRITIKHAQIFRTISNMSDQVPFTVPLPGGIPSEYKPHTESTTTILVPKANVAFLNPVQEYNRDMSVAVIRAWNEMRNEEMESRWRARREKQKGKGKKRKVREGEEVTTVNQSGQNEESEQNGRDAAAVPDITEAGTAEEDSSAPVAGPSTPYEPTFRAPKITIIEALSATGLRSIRYAKEIPDVKTVLANDISPSACDAMRRNVALNGVGIPEEGSGQNEAEASDTPIHPTEAGLNGAGDTNRVGRREGCKGRVKINEGDACTLMYSHRDPRHRVDVVDLDPYGTAAPFIDAAIGSIADGGLLCVTCTDLAVLAGSQYPEKCFSNYGGVCVAAEYSHETALRLVLNSIATTAARYGRFITPLLSFSIDFYVRLFIRVDSGPAQVKELASISGPVYICHYCQSATPQPLGRVVDKPSNKGQAVKNFKSAAVTLNGNRCAECGTAVAVAGPMYLGPIQDPTFAARVLKSIEGQQKDYGTWQRMNGMLTMAREELDEPFYFTMNKICGFFHTSSVPAHKTISALLNAEYKVSRSHASSGSIKTNAPRSFVFDIVRKNILDNPVRMDKIAAGSPARQLLSKPISHEIDFTPHKNASKWEKGEKVEGRKVVYYQENPTANWGPGSRAKNIKVDSGGGDVVKRIRLDDEEVVANE